MIAVLALALAATPVSLQLDLSRQTRERAGERLEEQVRHRLIEDGFELGSPAKILLRVEELHGVFRLSATVAASTSEPLTRQITPTGNEWRDELSFEIAQRLVSLAHEAEALVPALPEPVVTPEPPTPIEDAIAAADRPLTDEEAAAKAAGSDDGLRVGAGFRAGVLFRFPAVDPSFAVHGTIRTGVVEPVVLVGLTLGPGPGLFATEIPIAAGIRLRLAGRDAFFEIIPEALIGARLHFYGRSAIDEGGARADFMGLAGATASFRVRAIRLGLRVGVEVSAAREHVLGADVLWSRGPFGLGVQLVLERS